MAFTVGSTAAKDGAASPAAIPGGLLSADVAGGGVGPTFFFHGLVDGVAGVNKGQIDSSSRLAVNIAAAATAIAKAEDVASADADVGVPSMMVRKASPANTSGTDGDYEFLQGSAGRLWVDASGVSLTVGTHAITLAAGAAAIAKAEDAASADADVGVPSMAVQKATPANTAGTDGDYEFLQMSAGRLWTSSIITAAAASIGKAEDVASADADVGVPSMAVRKATPANTSGADGDYEFLQMSAGRLWTNALIGDGTNTLTLVQDTAGTNVWAVPVMIHPDSSGIIASGTAGTPASAVMSVQGVSGGTAQPVTINDISNGEWETVAASVSTPQVIGATGAAGDWLNGLLIVPTTTSPGAVDLYDGTNSPDIKIPVFAGGASSLSNLVPFFVPFGVKSVTGSWRVTTGAGLSVFASGNFT